MTLLITRLDAHQLTEVPVITPAAIPKVLCDSVHGEINGEQALFHGAVGQQLFKVTMAELI